MTTTTTFAALTIAVVVFRASACTGTAADDRRNGPTTANDEQPFWINPCGYKTNDDEDDDPVASIKRVLTLAKRCEDDANNFKCRYVRRTFNEDYEEHYRLWENVVNEWMTPRLLNTPDEEFSREWLDRRRFPDELTVTYEVLQRAAVGLELMTRDAAMVDTAESEFTEELAACRNDLRTLLCEVSDMVDAEDGLRRPKDVDRDVIPDSVRYDSSASHRNLTNSIIFRDYVIAVKYVTTVYGHFVERRQSSSAYHKNSLGKRDAATAPVAADRLTV